MKTRVIVFEKAEVEPFLRLMKWDEPKSFIIKATLLKTKELDLGEIRV